MSALVLITVLVLLQSSARAEFALSPGKWEVGTVAEGDKLSLTVTVTNPTTSPTSLRRVFHSCDCLSVRYTPLLLKPMESTTAELSFIAWGLDENFEFLLYFEGDGMSVVSFPIRGRFKGGGKARVYPELPVTPEGRALVIHFFFSPSCVGCDEIIAGPVRKVLEEFGDRVGFAAYDLSDATDNRRNYRLMRAFEEKHGLNDYAPVEIFVGSEALVGKEAVRTGLRDAVVRQLGLPDNTAVPPAPLVADDPALFDAATFGGAVVFGLVDGINPCVFAGLLLFFSCLVVSGLSGARLLAVGLVYALAVFLTYFAMGFALFSFFHGSAAFPLLRTATLALACGLAAVGAVLSARDALVAARGDASRLWLQLPHSLAERSRSLLTSLKGRAMVYGAAFVLGAVVTVIEGVCSGIQYVPACAMMVTAGETAGDRLYGLALLLVYNLAFIVPLLVLLVLALIGKRFTAARSIQRRWAVTARVGTTVLLAGVAIALFWLLLS